MAAQYPGTVPTIASNKANVTVTPTDHPNHHNQLAEELVAVATELGTDPAGVAATVKARLAAGPTNFADFGPDRTGATSCATQFAAWVDAVKISSWGLIPAGRYLLPSGATIDDLHDDALIEFAGNAEINHNAAGYALTFTNCDRLTLRSPRIGIWAGTAMTGGIKLGVGCGRSKIFDPVIWAYATIPTNYDGIVIDGADTAYWVEIHRPMIRPNVGGLGDFRRGISISGVSNATQVVGGDINNCATGVYISEANSCVVQWTALEGCGDGIELASGASQDAAGTRIWGCRFETCTYGVNITATRITDFALPIFLGAFSSAGDLTEEVHNPNGVPITYVGGTKVLLDSPDLATPEMDSIVRVRASGNQTEPIFEGVERGGARTWSVLPDGPMTMGGIAPAYAVNGALWRDNTDDRLKWRDGSGGDTAMEGRGLRLPCRVAASVNVTISAPGATIDGASMVALDRVLLTAQTTPSQNGIYKWNTAATAMTRSPDADSAAKMTDSLLVTVDEGTINKDSIWTLSTNKPITLETTALRFTRVHPSYEQASHPINSAYQPANSKLENLPRDTVGLTAQTGLTTQIIRVFPLGVQRAGDVLTALNFQVSLAAVTVTNSWAGIARLSDRKVLAVSATSTAAPAINTLVTFTFTSAFTADQDEVLVGFVMYQATTVPGFYGILHGNASIITQAPVVNGTSNTGQTTPIAVGATMTAFTAQPQMYYCFAT